MNIKSCIVLSLLISSVGFASEIKSFDPSKSKVKSVFLDDVPVTISTNANEISKRMNFDDDSYIYIEPSSDRSKMQRPYRIDAFSFVDVEGLFDVKGDGEFEINDLKNDLDKKMRGPFYNARCTIHFVELYDSAGDGIELAMPVSFHQSLLAQAPIKKEGAISTNTFTLSQQDKERLKSCVKEVLKKAELLGKIDLNLKAEVVQRSQEHKVSDEFISEPKAQVSVE